MADNYFLAEVSFEAGNKVGGIWTVLTSKSEYMTQKFGDNYLAVGFYNPTQCAIEFVETPPPQYIKDALLDIKLDGIKIYFGKWASANGVNLVLIDSKDFEHRHVNEIKKQFWDAFKIDSLNSPGDYDEPLAWSYAAGAFLSSLSKVLKIPMVAQIHEWLSAGAALYIKSNNIRIPTVFTVHATVLGRAISFGGEDTFNFVNSTVSADPSMPYKYGVAAKHLTEKAAALNSTVFTAVSKVVAKEAEVILGKKADFVTVNGIDLKNLPAQEELDSLRDNAQLKFENFVNAYFLPYYNFDAKKATIFLTGGRYEFLGKGYDLFIDALGRLDKTLSDDNYVIAFITVPSGTVGIKNEVVANYLTYMGIKSALHEDITNFDRLISSNPTIPETSIDRAYSKIINDTRRMTAQLRRPKPTNPPLCPLLLSYPEYDDMILNKLKENGLENSEKNHVKVIYYPKYLTVGDELLNLTYHEALSISAAGFFLSKYEPFGYTPLEAASYMAVAFTTDHAGFGEYYINEIKNPLKGIFVEHLINKKRDDIINQIAHDMLKITLTNKDELLSLKLGAREVSEKFGWEKFLPFYLQAYDAALKRI